MSRPQNLGVILEHYYHKLDPHPFEIRWLIGQQCGESDPKGAIKCNEMMDLVPDAGWFMTVADDTLCHPALLRRIGEILRERPELGAIIFSGIRNGAGLTLHALPESMRPCKVCGSQAVWNKKFLGSERFDFARWGGESDGRLISRMYNRYREKFLLVDEALTYFGSLEW